MHTTHRPLLASAALCVALAACGGDDDATTATTSVPPTSVINPGDPADHPELPAATEFVAVIDNPYLPFLPGSSWTYEGTSEGEVERVVVEVLRETEDIQGIAATVVRDRVYVADELVEDTYDWFAQDRAGNVWYLGEDVKDYEDGEVVSTEGSFEAGVDGARAGIVMPAHPEVGQAFRQELYPGQAEDVAEVVRLGASTSVPAGDFDDVLVTKDWNPLEPEPIEEKHYAPGVGLIYETATRGPAGTLELLDFTPGG